MKVIGSNSKFQLFSDDLKTYDKLPVGTYKIGFNPMQGFSLIKIEDFTCKEDKIYGNHPQKIQKVLRSYDAMDRSLGIILSGDKGMGKSLFVNLLAEKMIERDMPVIICQNNIGGVSEFIDEIKQDALFIFDEYEKNFPIEGDGETQNSMLSLFDGLSQTKRMYAITVNDLSKLSEFIKNRTGRFHYHIRFDYPTSEELVTYMEDKVLPLYHDQIKLVDEFARRVPINYDTLRSIAFELNMGNPFKEAITDMNIMQTRGSRYRFQVKLAGIAEPLEMVKNMDSFATSYLLNDVVSVGDDSVWVYIKFDPSGAKTNPTGGFYIPGDKVTITPEYRDEEDVKFVSKLKVEYVAYEIDPEKSIHYTL